MFYLSNSLSWSYPCRHGLFSIYVGLMFPSLHTLFLSAMLLNTETFSLALSNAALRKKTVKGRALFLQGDKADEMFLIKGGRIKLNKVLEE
jgi:CRP-like cAMP-binding protein